MLDSLWSREFFKLQLIYLYALWKMNWLVPILLTLQSIYGLSPNGTIEIKIGVHFPNFAETSVYAAFSRAAQLNNISTLIHPDAKLVLLNISRPIQPKSAVRAAFELVDSNIIAMIGTGSSGPTMLLSRIIQYSNIALWYH